MSFLDKVASAVEVGAGSAVSAPVTAIGQVASLGEAIIDRLIPDKQQADNLKLAFRQLDLQELGIQAGVAQSISITNTTEASSSDKFTSRWRPAIGWVCAISLGCYYIPRSIIAAGMWIWACLHSGQLLPYPEMSMGDLLGLTCSMLGFGVLRSMDKRAGIVP